MKVQTETELLCNGYPVMAKLVLEGNIQDL